MQKSVKQTVVVAAIIVVAVSLLAVSTVFKSSAEETSIALGAQLVWEQTFGGDGDDRAFYAAKADDGYVVVGSSTSFVQNRTVACIVRYDEAGNQLWNRTFLQNMGSEFRWVTSATGGFLVVGNSFCGSDNVEGLVLKLDTQGNIVWNVTLTMNGSVNKLCSAIVDGSGLVIVGLTQPLGNASQAWIIKLDQNGNTVWTTLTQQATECAARGIALTQDGGYMVAGYVDADGNGNYDFMVFKLDQQGNVSWTKTYGGSQSDKAYAITTTQDGFVVAGDTRSKGAGDCDAWIIKIDDNGNMVWDQVAGGTDFDSPTFITNTLDGGCVVCGTTFSFGNGLRDFWLLSLGVDGKVLSSCTVGRADYEEAYAAVSDGAGGYVVAGWTSSIGAGGRYDFYIVNIKLSKP